MRSLMQTVYDNYPQAVKFLKPTYESGLQSQVWYRLQLRGTSQWLYHRSNGSVTRGGESGTNSHWQFGPAVSDGLVGLLDRDGNRLKIETYSAAMMIGHSEDMKRGQDVVFKMVPLTNVNEPVIQMAGPFKQSDRSKYDTRANKDIGVVVPYHDWVLHKA